MNRIKLILIILILTAVVSAAGIISYAEISDLPVIDCSEIDGLRTDKINDPNDIFSYFESVTWQDLMSEESQYTLIHDSDTSVISARRFIVLEIPEGYTKNDAESICGLLEEHLRLLVRNSLLDFLTDTICVEFSAEYGYRDKMESLEFHVVLRTKLSEYFMTAPEELLFAEYTEELENLDPVRKIKRIMGILSSEDFLSDPSSEVFNPYDIIMGEAGNAYAYTVLLARFLEYVGIEYLPVQGITDYLGTGEETNGAWLLVKIDETYYCLDIMGQRITPTEKHILTSSDNLQGTTAFEEYTVNTLLAEIDYSELLPVAPKEDDTPIHTGESKEEQTSDPEKKQEKEPEKDPGKTSGTKQDNTKQDNTKQDNTKQDNTKQEQEPEKDPIPEEPPEPEESDRDKLARLMQQAYDILIKQSRHFTAGTLKRVQSAYDKGDKITEKSSKSKVSAAVSALETAIASAEPFEEADKSRLIRTIGHAYRALFDEFEYYDEELLAKVQKYYDRAVAVVQNYYATEDEVESARKKLSNSFWKMYYDAFPKDAEEQEDTAETIEVPFVPHGPGVELDIPKIMPEPGVWTKAKEEPPVTEPEQEDNPDVGPGYDIPEEEQPEDSEVNTGEEIGSETEEENNTSESENTEEPNEENSEESVTRQNTEEEENNSNETDEPENEHGDTEQEDPGIQEQVPPEEPVKQDIFEKYGDMFIYGALILVAIVGVVFVFTRKRESDDEEEEDSENDNSDSNEPEFLNIPVTPPQIPAIVVDSVNETSATVETAPEATPDEVQKDTVPEGSPADTKEETVPESAEAGHETDEGHSETVNTSEEPENAGENTDTADNGPSDNSGKTESTGGVHAEAINALLEEENGNRESEQITEHPEESDTDDDHRDNEAVNETEAPEEKSDREQKSAVNADSISALIGDDDE